MNRVVILWCLLMISGLSHAQAGKVKSSAKQQGNKVVKKTNPDKLSGTISLSSEAAYPAMAPLGPASSRHQLKIADPIILTLKERAKGNDVPISASGIVGMPKRAYGFANGHILLRSTTVTTSGTSTGMPTVGTGSSLGTIGSAGPFIGMNGKSPYAGSAMWGNARGLVNLYSSFKN